MEKIEVKVAWCERNFSASLGDNVPGAVAFTATTFEGLKKEARETLEFHVEGLVEDGEDVPQWLLEKDYEFDYVFTDMASLLQSLGNFASLAAISHVTGINQNLLSHYANGIKKPRPQQRERIVNGIHSIGQRLMAVM